MNTIPNKADKNMGYLAELELKKQIVQKQLKTESNIEAKKAIMVEIKKLDAEISKASAFEVDELDNTFYIDDFSDGMDDV